jgi:hypothetical protein
MNIMKAKDLKDYEVILESNSMLEKMHGITDIDSLPFKLSSSLYHVLILRDMRDMEVKPRGKFYMKDVGTFPGEGGVKPVCVGIDTTDGILRRKNFETEDEMMEWLKDDYKDIYSNEDVDSLDKMYKVYETIYELLKHELYYYITYMGWMEYEEPDVLYSYDHDKKAFLLMIDKESLEHYTLPSNEDNLLDKITDNINKRLSYRDIRGHRLTAIIPMTDKEHKQYKKWEALQLT